MKGTLTLIPTPINSEVPLDQNATRILMEATKKNSLFLVEEHKVARRRWLKEGLPRETIEDFVLYNEHSFDDAGKLALKALQAGVDVYLMSDCGLPAFCDPGRKLVDACHLNKIRITSAPFSNSIALALALSGFNHDRFMFEGFIPVKNPDRKNVLKHSIKSNVTTIIMDTPYRLEKLIGELEEISPDANVFLGMNLNSREEQLLRSSVKNLKKQIKKMKSEFILILEGKS